MNIESDKKTIVQILILIFCVVFIVSLSVSVGYGEPIVEEPSGTENEPPVTEEPTTPANPPATTPEPPTTVAPPTTSSGGNNNTPPSTQTTSIDTKLSELSIECGTLVPSFSPDQYSYTVYVNRDSENKSCRTSATARSSAGTTISAEGPAEFSGEDVQKKIIVTGTDGSRSEYVIDVHVLKDTELFIDNELYNLTEDLDIDALPGTFKKVETTFKDEKINAARSKDGNLYLVCFKNSSDNKLWYMLNGDKTSMYPVQIVEHNGEKYIAISSAGELVYGSNEEEAGYYLFDSSTGEIAFSVKNNPNTLDDKSVTGNIVVRILVAVVILACIGMCIYLLLSRKKVAANGNDNKYFRPYIHLEDEQVEIIGEVEEPINSEEGK